MDVRMYYKPFLKDGSKIKVFSFHCTTAPSGTGLLQFRGLTITLGHTIIVRTPLDE